MEGAEERTRSKEIEKDSIFKLIATVETRSSQTIFIRKVCIMSDWC